MVLINPNNEGAVQSYSAAFRLKLGTTNTRVKVCSPAFKRNPALAGPYWRHSRARKFLKVSAIRRCPKVLTHSYVCGHIRGNFANLRIVVLAKLGQHTKVFKSTGVARGFASGGDVA